MTGVPLTVPLPRSATRREAARNLLLAALATVALYFVPFAGFVTYPVRILVTFIHEGGHALATLLTGGIVTGLGIQPDGSGETLSRGGFGPLVSSAGYLGATLYGALLLALLRRGVPGRTLLGATGGFVALMTIPTLWHSPFGLFWGIALTLALIAGGRRLPATGADFAAGFLGVQCVLNALFDLRTLFLLSATSNVHTDAINMERMTLVPAVLWATLWIGMALAILWGVLIRPALKKG